MASKKGASFWCSLVVCAGVVSFTPVICHSETSTPGLLPSAPAGTGPLPDFSKGAKVGVFLSAQYIDRYRAVLPPEVAAIFGRRELAAEVALQPRQQLDWPKSWLSSAGKGATQGGFGALSEKFSPSHSFPYALPSEGDAAKDPASVGAAILWNSASIFWNLKSFELGVQLRIFRDHRSGSRDIGITDRRIYPTSFGVSPGTLPPVFREKISFETPNILRGLQWLTLRFLGTEEDYLWASSPSTGTVRQLTGSSRSDLVFARSFAPDDIGVWSGKVEGLQVRSLQLETHLVPVIEPAWTAPSKEAGGCRTLSMDTKADIQLNGDTRRFPDAPLDTPTNVVWVLRRVWKIEAVNRDPFSRDVRQSIYVDALTMLPVYRVTWDEAGILRRVTIGFSGLVSHESEHGAAPSASSSSSSVGTVPTGDSSPGNSAAITPFWRGQIMFGSGESGSSLLLLQSIKVCDDLSEGRAVSDFDPRALVTSPTAPAAVVVPGSRGAGGGGTESSTAAVDRKSLKPTPADGSSEVASHESEGLVDSAGQD